LAFNAIGVDRVHDLNFGAFADLADDAQGVVEIPAQRNYGRAFHHCLGQLAIAMAPLGRSTMHLMPARAAYAAAEAEVLPVLAQITAFAPRSTASETAMVMPRS